MSARERGEASGVYYMGDRIFAQEKETHPLVPLNDCNKLQVLMMKMWPVEVGDTMIEQSVPGVSHRGRQLKPHQFSMGATL